MSRFSKFLIGSFLVLCVSFAGLTYYIRTNLDPKLHQLIETNGSELLGGSIRVASVRTKILPPHVELKDIMILKKGTVSDVRAKVEQVDISLRPLYLFKKTIDLDVRLESPDIEAHLAEDTSKKAQSLTAAETTQLGINPNAPMAVQGTILIEQGHIKVERNKNEYELKDLDLALELRPSGTSKVQTTTDVNLPGFSFPLSLVAQFQIRNHEIKVLPSKLQAIGATIDFSGATNIDKNTQDWKFAADIPQVETLHAPLGTDCLKIHRGRLHAVGNYKSEGASAPVSSSGELEFDKLAAILNCQWGETKANGDAELSASAKFEIGDHITVQPLKIWLDLKQLNLSYKNIFNKQVGVPLQARVEGSVLDKTLSIKDFAFELAQFKAQANGQLAQTGSSSLSFQILPANLKGLESMFPLFGKQPVQGTIEAKGKIAGDLNKPRDLQVLMDPFKAHNIKAVFNWNKADTKINGPVEADIQATIKAMGQNLQDARATATIDLSGLEISHPKFIKTAKMPLSFNVSAAKHGNRIELSNTSIKLPGGLVRLKGWVESPQAPLMNLSFQTKALQLAPLLPLFPTSSHMRGTGTLDANVQLSGQYNFTKGVESSPLRLTGSGVVALQQFAMKSEKTQPKKSEAYSTSEGAAASKPEPILPNWPLFKNMDLHFKVTAQQILYDDLAIHGIQSQNILRQGIFSTQGSIKSIFNGQVFLQTVEAPLMQPTPMYHVAGKVGGIELSQVVEWMSKVWKGLASGTTSGNFDMHVPHPARPDFLKATTGKGHVQIHKGFLSTLQFDKMANEKLSKLPGLGSRSANLSTGGATAHISSDFSLANGILNLPNLDILTPEKNELQANGTVNILDKTCDMKALVFLADPPISGSVREANSDGKGRLKLPVAIKGSVFSPQVDLAGETAKTLLINTAKFEGEKLKSKLTPQLQQQLQDKGQQLKDEAEKQLKGLFH